MKEKTKKEKQGHARLFELAGARKNKLTLAETGTLDDDPNVLTLEYVSVPETTIPYSYGATPDLLRRRQTKGKFLPSVPLPSARRWSMASALTLPQQFPIRRPMRSFMNCASS